jgi:hypothetical protein
MVTYNGAASGHEAGNQAQRGNTETTKIYWVPGKTESRTWFAYETVKSRVANLKAIEMGHWTELEKPNRREKIRSIAALGVVGLIMVVVVLALFTPWHGKNLWDYATTNAVWKMIGALGRSWW